MNVRKEASGRIRITQTPSGEAPRWVRNAWVGLTLPAKPLCGYGDEPSRGVESGEPVKHRREFDVPQREALERLTQSSPRAAQWWRARGFPEGEQGYFCFGYEEAEVVSGVQMQTLVIWDNMETGRYRPALFITPPGGKP